MSPGICLLAHAKLATLVERFIFICLWFTGCCHCKIFSSATFLDNFHTCTIRNSGYCLLLQKLVKTHDERFTSNTSLSTFRSLFTTLDLSHPPGVQNEICQQEGTQCRRTEWTRRRWKHCLGNGMAGAENLKQNFLEKWHAANLKPWQ